jgi:hypothetical protein
MELRRASALLRTQPTLRITTYQLSSRLCRRTAFSTTTRQLADDPSTLSGKKPTEKSDKPEDPISHIANSNVSTDELVNLAFSQWRAERLASKTSQELSDILAKNPPRASTAPKRALPALETDENNDIYDRMFPSTRANGIGKTGFGNGGFSNPFSSQQSTETALERWKTDVEAMDKSLHLGLKTGRMMDVNPAHSDLAMRLGMLGSLTSRNKIRQDERRQKFHERPGLKRKRLKRERWRKRFSTSFATICARATSLARQGW